MRHQVMGEILRVDAACTHFFNLRVIAVYALTARCNLGPPAQKVKAQRYGGIFRIVHCVEWPLDRRVMRDEHKIASVLFFCQRAQASFLGGREVEILFHGHARRTETLLCLIKWDARHIPQRGQCDFKQRKLGGA